ncbi:MAG: VIT1/CCC1 transporter family protein [Candidatus Promineifilaceae bacterium]
MSSTESGMLSHQEGAGIAEVNNGSIKSNKQIVASRLGEIILGGQDGLVNVAGVILGLAAATDEVRIIIAGGLAATFAESISMAAVAYTSKLANKDFYDAETARETDEVRQAPESKQEQIKGIFDHWGFSGKLLEDVVDHITTDEEHWVEILMAHDNQLQPVPKKGLMSGAVLVGISAIVGSLIPLWPFFFFSINTAIVVGLTLTALVLYVVGVVKARLTVGSPSKSGMQMLVIGMAAALVGYAIGLLFRP